MRAHHTGHSVRRVAAPSVPDAAPPSHQPGPGPAAGLADHWANRKLLESMLRQRGYGSECVENGLEAVTIAATNEYDLILMVRIAPSCPLRDSEAPVRPVAHSMPPPSNPPAVSPPDRTPSRSARKVGSSTLSAPASSL